jgi:dimeric dUTPase (all-alpha-NTP-PPase superfamily)
VSEQQLFSRWLTETAELQRTHYDYDPRGDDNFEHWINYIREQTLAAFVELGEFISELKWKPWGKLKKFPTISERQHAVEEIVDVLHFVANALHALGVTDSELDREYLRKMQINRDRVKQGGH